MPRLNLGRSRELGGALYFLSNFKKNDGKSIVDIRLLNHNRARGQARDGATGGRPKGRDERDRASQIITSFHEWGAASPVNALVVFIW